EIWAAWTAVTSKECGSAPGSEISAVTSASGPATVAAMSPHTFVEATTLIRPESAASVVHAVAAAIVRAATATALLAVPANRAIFLVTLGTPLTASQKRKRLP